MSSTAWRSVGLNYINYSAICAKAVRRALKPDAQREALKREDTSVNITKWLEGKPVRKEGAGGS